MKAEYAFPVILKTFRRLRANKSQTKMVKKGQFKPLVCQNNGRRGRFW